MTLLLNELVGRDDRRFSPYCWRTRLALAHKGLAFETVPCKFTDKDKIAFSGQGRVPILVDGETVVSDSWAIALYLEEHYPDGPSLFDGEAGRALTLFVNRWCDREIIPALLKVIIGDVFGHIHPDDRAYFRETREKRLGATIEDLHRGREGFLSGFRAALGPIDGTLEAQPFLAGAAPAYADFIVFAAFQWARCVSRCRLVEAEDPIHAWRGRMLDLFDGMAARADGYPV